MLSRILKFTGAVALGSVSLFALQTLAGSGAATPGRTVAYRGVIEEDGQAVNGTLDLTFHLYDDASAGNVLWSETHSGVQVIGGAFAVQLGATHALDDHLALVSDGLYLEVEVNGTPLVGRQLLSSVPAALAGVPTGAIMPFNRTTCPAGWQPADGTNGTPDLRGVFLRGMESFDGGITQSDRDPGRSGADTVGSYQDDLFQTHTHSVSELKGQSEDYYVDAYRCTLPAGWNNCSDNQYIGIHTDTPQRRGLYDHTVTVGDPASENHGDETRPRNAAVLFCVKL